MSGSTIVTDVWSDVTVMTRPRRARLTRPGSMGKNPCFHNPGNRAVQPSSDLTLVDYVPAVYETELATMPRSFRGTSASRWTWRRLSGGTRARGAMPGDAAAGARRIAPRLGTWAIGYRSRGVSRCWD